MAKRGYENGNIVSIAPKKLRCEQGRWTPRTPDAFEQTYNHVMRVGVMNCKATAEAYRDSLRRASVEKLQRVIAKRKAIRANGGQVTQLDNV